MPPFIIVAIGAIGAAALARLLSRESRRINAELDEARRGTGTVEQRSGQQTLRRDPRTGEYRPGGS
jgi:hypothetical protein